MGCGPPALCTPGVGVFMGDGHGVLETHWQPGHAHCRQELRSETSQGRTGVTTGDRSVSQTAWGRRVEQSTAGSNVG